jgi:hypothetical protein
MKRDKLRQMEAGRSAGEMASAQIPTGDSPSKATSILNQSVAASGLSDNAVQGFTASGIITYFWGGESVQANERISAKGGDQFRFDADVPGGTKSLSINRLSGTSKDADGKLTSIPAHNTMTAAVLTFPYLSIASAVLTCPPEIARKDV